MTETLLRKPATGDVGSGPPDRPIPGWYTDPLTGVWLRHWNGARWVDDLPDAPAPRPPVPVRAAPPSPGAGALSERLKVLELGDASRLLVVMLGAVLTSVLVVALGIALTT